MPDIGEWDVVLRLLVAAALGAAVGLERELREREAGLRTHLLVSLGAALFMLVSAYAWTDWAFSTRNGLVFDPTRIAAQVVSGIGFLGAGAIIRQGLSVRGLTTAATLWVVAAIGLASGAGYYMAAVVTTAIVLVSLGPLRILGFRLLERIQPRDTVLLVDLRLHGRASALLAAIEAQGARVKSIDLSDTGESRRVTIDVDLDTADRNAVVAQVSELEEVASVRWRR